MRQLFELGCFVRALRTRMRFGELSRAPLRLLRLQLEGETAECEWMVRSPDAWDSALERSVRDQQASSQALRDAIGIRAMLFSSLPDVRTADLRAYRQSAREPPLLIISGKVSRDVPGPADPKRATSLAMSARLCGLKFWLEDGVLAPLESVDRRSESVTNS
jgi:hypothetical protein